MRISKYFWYSLLFAGISYVSAEDDTSCLDTIFPCSHTIAGNLFLAAIYGLLLCVGAKLISDGSELLLEILDPGIIGGFVLPCLGAVPDAAIILVSGLASHNLDELRQNLQVGVGTLAGSTVFLLTIPWAFSLWLARCDLGADGLSKDKTLSPEKRFDLMNTGITIDKDTQFNAKIMVGTSMVYFLIQGVAFSYLADPDSANAEKAEHGFALTTLIACVLMFVGYSFYQVYNSRQQEDKIRRAKEERERKLALEKARALILRAFTPMVRTTERSGLLEDGSSGGSGISSEEAARKAFGKWKAKAVTVPSAVSSIQADPEAGSDGEEEEEEKSNDPPHIIALKAAGLLGLGVFVVSAFSDPMVDTLSEMGSLLKVNPFYLSFVITPLCSNASETISSLIFASRKMRKNAAVTYSQIYGAVCMNNTLCLGIFVALIYFKGATWDFSAEVLSILFATWGVAVFALKNSTLKTWMAIPVLAFFPLGLCVVALFENVVGWK